MPNKKKCGHQNLNFTMLVIQVTQFFFFGCIQQCQLTKIKNIDKINSGNFTDFSDVISHRLNNNGTNKKISV